MTIPLIVSITRRVRGLETLRHFVILDGNLSGGYKCIGCGTYLWDRLSPVELADGGAIDPDATPDCSPLCRPCSFRGGPRCAAGAGWSGLTTDDVSALWRLVTIEQARELECLLEGYRVAALQETQAAVAALELAGSDQGFNDSRKVA